MTDLTPNDLSHLSDEEFNELCPQGYHAPGSASALSPAAQSVLDAFSERHELCGPFDGNWQELCLAAALRAAADQVVPDNYASFTGHIEWDRGMETRNDSIRAALLAIAAELEGSHD
jgi:hypothetical protein